MFLSPPPPFIFPFPSLSFGTRWFCIEHFLSVQQRRRLPPLRTPTRRPLRHRKRNIRQRPRLRHRLLLNIPTRLTRLGLMPQRALRNNRHLRLRLNPWCSSSSLSLSSNLSSSNRRRPTRTNSLVISTLLRMYVSCVSFSPCQKKTVSLTWSQIDICFQS